MDQNLKQQLEGQFDTYKGRIKEAFGSLTDDDLKKSEGKYDQLVGAIKQKTGKGAQEIEQKLSDLISSS